MKLRTNCMSCCFPTYLYSPTNSAIIQYPLALKLDIFNGQSSAFYEKNNSLARRRKSNIPQLIPKCEIFQFTSPQHLISLELDYTTNLKGFPSFFTISLLS